MERKQLTIRIPDELYRKLHQIGREMGVPIQPLITFALMQRVNLI